MIEEISPEFPPVGRFALGRQARLMPSDFLEASGTQGLLMGLHAEIVIFDFERAVFQIELERDRRAFTERTDR